METLLGGLTLEYVEQRGDNFDATFRAPHSVDPRNDDRYELVPHCCYDAHHRLVMTATAMN